jgi:hypothetical protein
MHSASKGTAGGLTTIEGKGSKMSLPQGHIRTPHPDDYCHIDRIYAVFFGSSSSAIIQKNLDPSNISFAEEMYGCRLPREVFIPLFAILKPFHRGVHIRTPEDLDALADDASVMDISQFDAHTRDQRSSFHLKMAERSKNIDWRSLAEMYNEMDPESRKAVKGFFKYCLGFNLRKLMDNKAPDLAVPEDLRSKTASFELDGRRMVNCDLAKAPVPETDFCRQFSIVIRRDKNQINHFVGSAGTPEIAIAKAWAFLKLPSKRFPFPQGFDMSRRLQYPFMSKVMLMLDGSPFMLGEIEYTPIPRRGGEPVYHHTPEVAKITWSRELTARADQEPHRMSIRTFEASLFRAEAALGLTSSKGRYLEESLGL